MRQATPPPLGVDAQWAESCWNINNLIELKCLELFKVANYATTTRSLNIDNDKSCKYRYVNKRKYQGYVNVS